MKADLQLFLSRFDGLRLRCQVSTELVTGSSRFGLKAVLCSLQGCFCSFSALLLLLQHTRNPF